MSQSRGLSRSLKRSNRIQRKQGAADDYIILSADTPWSILESYNALRTNIIFSLPGMNNQCKVFGVTSSLPGEGKSTNCINMALSFAQLGKNVLIIDADMRLPTVAAKFGIQIEGGLSGVLVGECSLLDSIVHSDKLHLDVLPSGKIPPDATKLMQSKQMSLLIEALRKTYEYIFIDLPPVTTVADATIMSEYVDGFLLVVRHASTDSRAVSEMVSELRFAGANIIGFIYNGAEIGKKGGRYYSNYYRK